MRNTKVTKVTHDVTLTLDGEGLLELLRDAGEDIPDGASVHVRVPGGGDWSNMDLEIGVDAPLTVIWHTKESI